MSQSNWPHAAHSTAYRLASAVDAAVFSALPALTSFCCHHIRDIACRAPEGPPKLVADAKQTKPRDAKAPCIQRDPAIQRPMPSRLNLEMQRIPKGTKNSFMVLCFSVLDLLLAHLSRTAITSSLSVGRTAITSAKRFSYAVLPSALPRHLPGEDSWGLH